MKKWPQIHTTRSCLEYTSECFRFFDKITSNPSERVIWSPSPSHLPSSSMEKHSLATLGAHYGDLLLYTFDSLALALLATSSFDRQEIIATIFTNWDCSAFIRLRVTLGHQQQVSTFLPLNLPPTNVKAHLRFYGSSRPIIINFTLRRRRFLVIL